MSLKNKILLTCKDATLLICKQQEDAASFKEKIQLKIHLLVCKFCSLFFKQSNQLHEHLKTTHKEEELLILALDEQTKIALQEKINNKL